MPIPSEPVQVVLEGLDEKTSAKLQAPGKLERARNVQFDKQGQLDKRRGYRMLEDTQADARNLPAIVARLALDGDALLVLSTIDGFAVHDPTEGLQATTRAAVWRGCVSSGNVSIKTIVVSSDTEEPA